MVFPVSETNPAEFMTAAWSMGNLSSASFYVLNWYFASRTWLYLLLNQVFNIFTLNFKSPSLSNIAATRRMRLFRAPCAKYCWTKGAFFVSNQVWFSYFERIFASLSRAPFYMGVFKSEMKSQFMLVNILMILVKNLCPYFVRDSTRTFFFHTCCFKSLLLVIFCNFHFKVGLPAITAESMAAVHFYIRIYIFHFAYLTKTCICIFIWGQYDSTGFKKCISIFWIKFKYSFRWNPIWSH